MGNELGFVIRWRLGLEVLQALQQDQLKRADADVHTVFIFLWFMLARPDQDPGRIVPALAAALAIGKYALLAAVVLILVLALRRARA